MMGAGAGDLEEVEGALEEGECQGKVGWESMG